MPFRRSIISVRETMKLDARGELERWKIVEYMLDDYGPFIFEVPTAQFSWDALKEEMAKEEAGIQSVIGTE